MRREFTDERDVEQGLGNCVLFSEEDNKFVYVVTDGMRVNLYELGNSCPNRNGYVASHEANRFEYRTDIELGYVNLQSNYGCVYASRLPMRQFKIGLNCSNTIGQHLSSIVQKNNGEEYSPPGYYHFEKVCDASMKCTLDNIYPEVSEDLFMPDGGRTAIAITRNIALQNLSIDIVVAQYKNVPIGVYNIETNKIELARTLNPSWYGPLIEKEGVEVK